MLNLNLLNILNLCLFILLSFLSFLFGASIGSFIEVLIDRLPRKESIIFIYSHCPYCNKKIKWNENIPVLSYILLKGKCSSCKHRIPIRYLIIELFFGVISLTIFLSILIPLIFPQLP